MAEAGGDRLIGWKAIAAHLSRDERTAKRWEATRALPVRRLPGGPNASVFASRAELDAWLATTGRAIAPEPDPASEPAAAAVAGADAVAHVLTQRRPRVRWRLPAAVAAGAAAAVVTVGAAMLPHANAPLETSTHADAARPADPIAANTYFAGLHALGSRTPAGIAQAEHYFEATIERAPRFAPAHVALADSFALAREFGVLPDAVAFPQAEREARLALALDPNSAGAQRVLGFVLYWFHHDTPGAERAFRRSLELAPNDARTHHWFANILSTIGRIPEALAEIDRARALDPEATAIQSDRALILAGTDLPGARAELARLAALDPMTPGPAEWSARLSLRAHDGPGFVRWAGLAARLRGDPLETRLAQAADAGLRHNGWPGLLHGLLAEVRRQRASGGRIASSIIETSLIAEAEMAPKG